MIGDPVGADRRVRPERMVNRKFVIPDSDPESTSSFSHSKLEFESKPIDPRLREDDKIHRTTSPSCHSLLQSGIHNLFHNTS